MSDHPRDVAVFTGDEMYESVRVEGERILEGVCAALGLDPNLGDDEAGDAVSWIVAAVRAKYESDSSQESLADALEAADRALNFAREEIPHDWATRVAAFPAVRAALRGVVRAAPREPSPRVAEIRALVDEYEHANAATVATMGLPAGLGVVRLALIRELLDMVESRPVRELSVEGLAAMLDEMPWRVVEETRGDNADAAYWLLGRIGAGVGVERTAEPTDP